MKQRLNILSNNVSISFFYAENDLKILDEINNKNLIKSIYMNRDITKEEFERDENIDPKLNLTFNEAQEKQIKYSLSNTFGFGGHNASTLFKKFSE